jgi:hypothetical protein
MRRGASVLTLLCGVILVATTPPLGLAQEDDPGLMLLEPELRNGTWFGTGIAEGTAELEHEGVELILDLVLHSNFYFDVFPDGTVEGEWDLVPPSSGTMDMYGNGQYAATLDATYSGTGAVTGDRRHLQASGTTSQVGVVTGVSSGSVQSNSTDELPSEIVVEVTTAFCNEAYGQWEVSWEQALESVGWEPNFTGEWVAVRQTKEFESEIEDGQIERFLNEITDTIGRWGEMVVELQGRDWSTRLSNAEWNGLIDLFEEFERLQNELRNLTPCDREVIGEDNLEAWDTALSTGMLAVIEGAALGSDLTGTDISDLVTLGLRAGVFGEGSPDLAIRSETGELLRREAETIVNDHYELGEDETGRFFDPVPGAHESEELYWAVDAGVQMGWTFTLRSGDTATDVTASELMGS